MLYLSQVTQGLLVGRDEGKEQLLKNSCEGHLERSWDFWLKWLYHRYLKLACWACWSTGMILTLVVRGPGFKSRTSPLPFGFFFRWLGGKESACQCRRHRRHGFSPWAGKIPWNRKWEPTPTFLLGQSPGQRSLVGYTVHAVTKSWTWLSK